MQPRRLEHGLRASRCGGGAVLRQRLVREACLGQHSGRRRKRRTSVARDVDRLLEQAAPAHAVGFKESDLGETHARMTAPGSTDTASSNSLRARCRSPRFDASSARAIRAR